MSFNARFDLPTTFDDELMEEQCSNCPSRHLCHKLSYCAMEEY